MTNLDRVKKIESTQALGYVNLKVSDKNAKKIRLQLAKFIEIDEQQTLDN